MHSHLPARQPKSLVVVALSGAGKEASSCRRLAAGEATGGPNWPIGGWVDTEAFPCELPGLTVVRRAAQEVRRLQQVERAGESEWKPWIAVAGLSVFFLALGLLMVGIAEASVLPPRECVFKR